MPLDLPTITLFLSGISSIAVIAGAVFVVSQLRQNEKLVYSLGVFRQTDLESLFQYLKGSLMTRL
ncbi:MAG TPA: hypothetical protein VJN71_00780 [Nitrososphaerales archaeon]|nr:hypothetical protein [Nitrososphaerales archaeon]